MSNEGHQRPLTGDQVERRILELAKNRFRNRLMFERFRRPMLAVFSLQGMRRSCFSSMAATLSG